MVWPAEPQSQSQLPNQSRVPWPAPPSPSSAIPQNPAENPPVLPDVNTHLSQKQKDALLKSNFQSTQRDVDKLNKLVQALQTEIKKSNSQVLSLKIVEQAGKIEKLAHKIRNELKAY